MLDPNQGFGGSAVVQMDLDSMIYLVRSLVAVGSRRRDPNAPRKGNDLTIFDDH